jgi:N-acyl-L-homoserine lactone synthetase
MVDIITAENKWEFDKQLHSMFEDRKRVFVDLLRWDLPITDGRLEIDQFDDDDAVYLVLSDSAGEHMGSLRLLRTDHPHILGNLFPSLCEQGAPTDFQIMEITRLCLCPRLPAFERLRVRNKLISAMVDYALVSGIKTLTGVVTARFLAQILKMGWRCEPLGPPQRVDGMTIGAFRIDIGEATPRLLQATGIYMPAKLNEYLSCEV